MTSDMVHPTAATATPRVHVLDGLRGLAVAIIVVYHLHEYIPQLWPGRTAFGETGRTAHVLGFLWIGVDLFYVLSGFFIGSAVLRPVVWNPLAFLKSRLTRILPAYYISIVVTLVLLDPGMVSSLVGWIHISMHLLMLHNLQEWTMFSINGPYWTLGVEFAFYMMMLALGPVWRSRHGWLLLLLMFAVCYVWRAGIVLGVPVPQRFFMASQFPGALDEFAMGIAIALIHQRGWLSPSHRSTWAMGLPLALIGTALVGACMLHFVTLQVGYWTSFPTVVFSRTALGAGFSLWIAACLIMAQHPILIRAMRYSLLGWIGKVSFSTYLYHVPVILLLHQATKHWAAPGWTWIASAVALMAGVSYLSYRWAERPWHAGL